MDMLQQLVGVALPIVQAPMADVQGNGGLGSLSCALLGSDALRCELEAIRRSAGSRPEVSMDYRTRTQNGGNRGILLSDDLTTQAGTLALPPSGTAGHYTLPVVQLNTARYEAPKDARRLVRYPR